MKKEILTAAAVLLLAAGIILFLVSRRKQKKKEMTAGLVLAVLGAAGGIFALRMFWIPASAGKSGTAAAEGSESVMSASPDREEKTKSSSEPISAISSDTASSSVPASGTEENNVSADQMYQWISEHQELFPENELEKCSGNPDLIQFLYRYGQKQYEVIPAEQIQYTSSEKEETIPTLFQWDARWGYTGYGSSVIGITGCGPTCMTMVIVGLTGDTAVNPVVLSRWAADNGYYQNGTTWGFFRAVGEAYGLSFEDLVKDEQVMAEELSNGAVIVCNVKKGHFTTSGHYIVLTGYQDGKFSVHDPNNRANTESLWDYETIQGEIASVWAFRYTSQAPASAETE